MSTPSQWPLTTDAVRQITPGFMLKHLQNNPLTSACYPTAFGYYPHARGHRMQRAEHRDHLIIYCQAGTGHLQTDHFRGAVKAGDVALLSAGQAHQYQSSDHDPWTIYWIHVDGTQTRPLFVQMGFNPDRPVISIGLQPQLASDFNRLLGLRQSGYRYSVFNYAAALCSQILSFLALQIETSNIELRHNFNLDQLRSLMLENLHGELDLDTLAASAKLSRHHFATKYKQLTGISPIKHFIHLKMERACYLLDVSHDSIKRVASQLGYDDALYFSRVFKKVIGLSPSEYRLRDKG